ncbi:MAG: hypothetical protein JRM80_06445 [Nitrososphaerota archaeon]|nr:hypothetical protein [Nitrososphaerota archaeon]
MHGSLARKLRAIGFDASYYKAGEDEGVIELAAAEGRVLLTSDRSLAARASSKGIPTVLLAGKTDGSRLREVSRAAARSGIRLVRGDSLCSLCGGALEKVARADLSGLVPPSVERSHRLFYRCASCGQPYWHGSHWKKLRSFAGRLEEK